MNTINTGRQTAATTDTEERKMKITGSKLIRWAGLPAMLAGIIFAGIQPIHPTDALSSVNTTAWAIITPLKTVMCLFFMLGLTGLYARQVNKAGWLGLAGYLLFGLSWAVNLAYIFAEAFILPPLATAAPKFAQDFIFGVITGRATETNLGALPTIFQLNGLFYLLGGLLFGIATFRSGILSRWPAGLLAVAALLTPLAALFPHEIQRYAGMPVGIAVAWLGYSLLSERRAPASQEQASQPVPGKGIAQILQPAAE
ncbi:MAG TPA: hypothetical protein VEX13_12590 [Chloroflexia bacterium]|nr:hypothetical protein [Chloroflexia bacterium]